MRIFEREQNNKNLLFLFFAACLLFNCTGPKNMVTTGSSNVRRIAVDSGWAGNSVNTTVFRKNSIVSYGDSQFIAFYDPLQFVEIGKRRTGESNWQLKKTPLAGHASDAHNVICIMTDGAGYLHLAWDHHNNRLHYAKSLFPGSLDLGPEEPMTGKQEDKLSYPEFYRLPNGNLLFFYRDGGSGNGNLVINSYDLHTKKWTQLQSNLIDGEGRRNAYWQACVDQAGTIHISWTWRETPDVATNHDICYARSVDGGKTWEDSKGHAYQLPITMNSAEIALHIPQKMELINQTSMFADSRGFPYIASYWRDSGSEVPQYHLLYKNESGWQVQSLHFHSSPFSLSGMGTKRIPMSRPQIIAWNSGNKLAAALIFRDEERKGRVSIATSSDLSKHKWEIEDLTEDSMGSWEPSYDTELWKNKKLLHLFIQHTEQVDAEGSSNLPPQMVEVLEWHPNNN